MNITNQDLDAYDLFLHALADLVEIVNLGNKTSLEVLAPEIIRRNRLLNSIYWLFVRDDVSDKDVISSTKDALIRGVGPSFTASRMALVQEMMSRDSSDISFNYDIDNKRFLINTDSGMLVMPVQLRDMKNMSCTNLILRDLFYVDAKALLDAKTPIDDIWPILLKKEEYSILRTTHALNCINS